MASQPKVWKYGNNVNTDMLFPGKYTYTCSKVRVFVVFFCLVFFKKKNLRQAPEILPHLLEDLDPTFAKNVKRGDILLVGENFGCGSSREQPALGLYAAGIRAIIGKSFARIFYRASINQGLILIECPAAVDAFVPETSSLDLNIEGARIVVDGNTFEFPKLPAQILSIRDAGGLLEYTVNRLRAAKKH